MLEELIEYATKFDWYRLRFYARSIESYNPDDYSAYEQYDSYLATDACTKAVRASRTTLFIEEYEIRLSLSLPFDEQFDSYKNILKQDFDKKRKKYLQRLEWLKELLGNRCDEMLVTDYIKEVGGRKSTPFKEWDRLLKVYDLRKHGLAWIDISKNKAIDHFGKTKSKTPDSSAIHMTRKDFIKAEKLIKSASKWIFPKI